MRGTEHGLHLRVRRGSGVLVIDGYENRGAERFSLKNAAQDAAFVLFLTWSDDIALAGASPVKFYLDLLRGDGESGRAAVDDATDPAAMGLAPGGDAEQGAEDAGHKERPV